MGLRPLPFLSASDVSDSFTVSKVYAFSFCDILYPPYVIGEIIIENAGETPF